MLNLYSPLATKNILTENFDEGEKSSIVYHNIFDYPLTFAQLIKWKSGKSITGITNITSKNGYYFLEGREGLVYKRLLRKKISAKKLEIAKKASRILSFIPSIKMVAVTGSLAMQNSNEDGDIDLMIITKKESLWTTRLLTYLVTWLLGMKLRKPGDKDQKDKLCLNMWLDESELVWLNRNIYTAHEIAQIVPLVNKENTYEKFLDENRWILSYWPNSVKIRNKRETSFAVEFSKFKYLNIISDFVLHASNLIAFKMQYLYMKRKITRETVDSTHALFHPQDWGKMVLARFPS